MPCIIRPCNNPNYELHQIRRGTPVILKYKYCKRHFDKYCTGQRRTKDKYTDNAGYVIVKTSDGRWRGEHRILMENKIGRKLLKNESVHHKNGVRHDNSLDNLELWVGNIIAGQRAADLTCPHCHMAYYKPF